MNLQMLQAIELLAVVAGATYGVLLARRLRMDAVGVCSVSFVIAFGGGTLRDLCLDQHPLFWIRHDEYAAIVFCLAMAGAWLRRIPEIVERWLYIPDALGLGLFSVAGAGIAIQAGTSSFIAVLLGVVTGTFGGVIGDIVCNRIPSLFRRSTPLYATCSFAGCWMYLLLVRVGADERIAMPASVTFIVAFRLLALHKEWSLPGPRVDDLAETGD